MPVTVIFSEKDLEPYSPVTKDHVGNPRFDSGDGLLHRLARRRRARSSVIAQAGKLAAAGLAPG
jgi:hypothetical protein